MIMKDAVLGVKGCSVMSGRMRCKDILIYLYHLACRGHIIEFWEKYMIVQLLRQICINAFMSRIYIFQPLCL